MAGRALPRRLVNTGSLSIGWIAFFAITAPPPLIHHDPRLFDLLNDLTAPVGRSDAELRAIRGCRTPWRNQFLRTHTAGVPQHSLRMEAEAIDIPLVAALRAAALAVYRKRRPYYAESYFIHVDVGRLRRW
jgi:uncharacterized protein YcbK (DUF882 family)